MLLIYTNREVIEAIASSYKHELNKCSFMHHTNKIWARKRLGFIHVKNTIPTEHTLAPKGCVKKLERDPLHRIPNGLAHECTFIGATLLNMDLYKLCWREFSNSTDSHTKWCTRGCWFKRCRIGRHFTIARVAHPIQINRIRSDTLGRVVWSRKPALSEYVLSFQRLECVWNMNGWKYKTKSQRFHLLRIFPYIDIICYNHTLSRTALYTSNSI